MLYIIYSCGYCLSPPILLSPFLGSQWLIFIRTPKFLHSFYLHTMEDQDMHICAHINSVDMSKLMPTSLAYFNKKRKFQAEQLGMPLPKHMCSYHSSAECSSSHTGTEAKESFACTIIAENAARGKDDDSELQSENGSNSFSGDADSVPSHAAKIDPGWLKSCSSDQASTSSVNMGGKWSKNALHSLDSRPVSKFTPDRPEQSPTGKGWGILHHGSGCHPSMDYEEHLLGFGNHGDCTCAECGTEGIELSTEKELENLLNDNVNPNNYVLSSGRWTVNQDSQPSSTKLTIDKEFEQYFSMLML